MPATSGLPAGTLPTAEQSTNTSNLNFEANQNTNRLMNVTIGSIQTSLAKSVPEFHLQILDTFPDGYHP